MLVASERRHLIQRQMTAWGSRYLAISQVISARLACGIEALERLHCAGAGDGRLDIRTRGRGYQIVLKKTTGADALSAGLVEDHKACFPGNAVLKKRLDDWTEAFEAEEERRRREAASAQEEQGWTVVKRRGVRLTAPEFPAAIWHCIWMLPELWVPELHWSAEDWAGPDAHQLGQLSIAYQAQDLTGSLGLLRHLRASELLQFKSEMQCSTNFSAAHSGLSGVEPFDAPARKLMCLCDAPSCASEFQKGVGALGGVHDDVTAA